MIADSVRSRVRARSDPSGPTAPARDRERGLSLVETLVVGAILAIGTAGLLAVEIQSMALTRTSRETATARLAASLALERLAEVPVSEAFATFNEDPADDPAGEGTAAGPVIALPSRLAGLSARVSFPTDDAGRLREDLDDPDLGLPFDLDGDGEITDGDRSADYRTLPVTVRVTWASSDGEREIRLHTVLRRAQP